MPEVNVNNIMKQIESLQPGEKLHYHTGKSMWLCDYRGLMSWFKRLQESGRYTFVQRRVATDGLHGVYEYYIWLKPSPDDVKDSRTIANLRRTLRVS